MVDRAREGGEHASSLCGCCNCGLSVNFVCTNSFGERGSLVRLVQSISGQVKLVFFLALTGPVRAHCVMHSQRALAERIYVMYLTVRHGLGSDDFRKP